MSLEFIERFGIKQPIRKNENKSELISKLTHLYMNDKNFSIVGDISACVKLKVLYLHNNKISKIDNLNKLTQLTHLYLQWNKIEKIENLECLQNLRKLYLGHNYISKLENIHQLMKLEELHMEKQILAEDQVFDFEAESLNAIAASLRVLNITKLNLTSIDDLKVLQRLEIILASQNNFKCPNELGCLPLLRQVDFKGCPAQRDVHYREKITAGADQLEILDDKIISKNTRNFIKNFEQRKADKKPPASKIEEKMRKTNSEFSDRKYYKPHNCQSKPTLVLLSTTASETSFQSWNTLQSANKIRRAALNNKKMLKQFQTDDVLHGTMIPNKSRSASSK